jgi:hypothetical protein
MASRRLFGPTRASNVTIAQNVSGALAQTLPAVQLISGSTETQIVDPGVIANLLILSIPPGSPLEQRPFEVLVSGYVTTATTATATVSIYEGTSTTIASNKKLATTGASASLATASCPFELRIRCIYDSVSGKLDGYIISGIIGGTLVTPAAFTAGSSPYALTIINTNNPVLSFTLTATFSSANAGNTIHIQEFCVLDE